MNNYEKIKNMNIDEMAYWVGANFEITCDFCDRCNGNCIEGFKQWLEKEFEDDN